jgi:hypothetical protein
MVWGINNPAARGDSPNHQACVSVSYADTQASGLTGIDCCALLGVGEPAHWTLTDVVPGQDPVMGASPWRRYRYPGIGSAEPAHGQGPASRNDVFLETHLRPMSP